MWATSGIIENHEWRWVFIVSVILLVLLLIPFIWAYGVGVPEAYFMGTLVTPGDGLSYQAKMYQGYQGSWLFHLPYTPEPHEGVFLFTFYLGLGHLARVLNTSTILVFHAVRMVGALLMFLAFYRFVSDWTDEVRQRRMSWTVGILGSGFGLMALRYGHIAPDMLVLPEAFPLQAAYANPHFPWAITFALTIAHILTTSALSDDERWPEINIETLLLAVGAFFLVSVSPFVLLPIGVGYGVLLAWQWRRRRAFPLRQLSWGAVVILFALPLAIYNAWAISASNPIFNAWMQQNLTPSPPVWDYLIAFGPMLFLAGIGLWGRRKNLDVGDVFLLGWLLSAMLMLYAPLGLQRRFTMGLIAPLAVYAGCGVLRVFIPRFFPRRPAVGMGLALMLVLPTTLAAMILPMMGSFAVLEGGGGSYFIMQGEEEAALWLEENAPGALTLSSPAIGLFLPAYGQRVVYGHPYETLNADARFEAVNAFYSGTDCSVVADEGVDYIFVGPREHTLSGEGDPCPVGGDPVFESSDGTVLIYAASGD